MTFAAPKGQDLGPRQQIFRSHAVGNNQGGGIGGMEPGFLIRGVVVDNPSGSWIVLRPTLQYVKPYTYAWSTNLVPGQQVLTAEYVDGPVGQPSTVAGEPFVIYLYDIQIGNSVGSTFVETGGIETSILSGPITSTAQPNAEATAILLTPPAGKRIRFQTATITPNFGTAPVNLDCPTKAKFRRTSDLVFIVQLVIGLGKLSDTAGDFTYDLPIDDALDISVTSMWAKVSISYHIRYQII